MSTKKLKVVFSGGGSGGHSVVALTLAQFFHSQGHECCFIGSYHGIEKKLVTKHCFAYYAISTGKLRRYFSWQNFSDLLRVFWGTLQSFYYLLNVKSDVVVTTGGFVTVPVVIAAWTLRIPIYIHEQTSRLGLANKIASYFAREIFITFDGTKANLPSHKKVTLTGYPLRNEFFQSDMAFSELVLPHYCFPLKDRLENKKLLLVLGGGNGSELINQLIIDQLEDLTQEYQVIHQVGQKYLQSYLKYASKDYGPFGFLENEFVSLLKAADIVIGRSGAGTCCELMTLGKPALFVPLKIAQKNEQYHNAVAASEVIPSKIILEDDWKLALQETGLLRSWINEVVSLSDTNLQSHISASKGQNLPASQLIYSVICK